MIKEGLDDSQKKVKDTIRNIRGAMDKRCEFEKDSKRCNAYKITDSKYCFVHSDDPEVVEMRQQALKKAGESHKLFLPIDNKDSNEVSGSLNLPKFIDLGKAKGIKKAYITIIKASAQGLIDEKRLGALTYALNGYVNALNTIELLERIEALEMKAHIRS